MQFQIDSSLLDVAWYLFVVLLDAVLGNLMLFAAYYYDIFQTPYSYWTH